MKRSCVVLALLSFSVAATAEGLDYSYVQGSYSQVELDDVDVDGDGFGIGGSFAIADNFAVFGGYETGELDFDIESTGFQIGGLFHTPLSDRVDLVSSLAYVWTELDAPGFSSVDDNGFGLGVGLRGMATPKVEWNGGVSYVDFNDGGDDTSFGAGVRYHFTEAFSAGLSGGWGDDSSSYGISGRMSFGN